MYNILNDVPGKNQVDVNIKLNKNFNPILLFIETLTSWELEISSVIGQPPSLDRNHFSTPRVVAESHKRDERCRPSSQRPQTKAGALN